MRTRTRHGRPTCTVWLFLTINGGWCSFINFNTRVHMYKRGGLNRQHSLVPQAQVGQIDVRVTSVKNTLKNPWNSAWHFALFGMGVQKSWKINMPRATEFMNGRQWGSKVHKVPIFSAQQHFKSFWWNSWKTRMLFDTVGHVITNPLMLSVESGVCVLLGNSAVFLNLARKREKRAASDLTTKNGKQKLMSIALRWTSCHEGCWLRIKL